MSNNKKREYWHKQYEIPLEEDIKLKVSFRLYAGEISRFSLVLIRKFENTGWRHIRQYDNTKQHEGRPHQHIYNAQGGHRMEYLGDENDNTGEIFTEIINYLKENYSKIIEYYKYSN